MDSLLKELLRICKIKNNGHSVNKCSYGNCNLLMVLGNLGIFARMKSAKKGVVATSLHHPYMVVG